MIAYLIFDHSDEYQKNGLRSTQKFMIAYLQRHIDIKKWTG